MVDEVNGFIADTGYCDFEFEQYRGKEFQKFWRLTKWWDNTSFGADAYPGVAPQSLGKVLTVFR